jgi:hypothetical protein
MDVETQDTMQKDLQLAICWHLFFCACGEILRKQHALTYGRNDIACPRVWITCAHISTQQLDRIFSYAS